MSDKNFDILMYTLCLGTIIGGTVFGAWAMFLIWSL